MCVFSQMKDIKYIRQDFHSVAWVMPKGSDLGVPWGVEWSKNFFFSKFNQICCVSYLHQWHMQRHNFLGPHLLGPCGGAKKSNIIISQIQSQFQRFLKQTLCVFSHMKDIKNIRRYFYSFAWVMPKGWDFGVLCVCVWGGGVGVQKCFSQIQPDLVCELLT